MCKQETKVCKGCLGNKTAKNFSIVGDNYLSTYCRDCANRRSREKKQRQLSRKRTEHFGNGWKDLVKNGEHQACKKCKSVKPILEFQRKTKSGVSTCWSCGATPKPLPVIHTLKSFYPEGKGQICNHCKQDKPIDEFGYNNYHCKHVKVCKECIAQKAKDKRLKEKNGDCSNVDYVNCNICGCVGLLTDRRKYYVKGACYKCGVNNKPRKPKIVTCKNCGCEVVSSSGQSKYCPPCRKEWQHSHMTRIAEDRSPKKRKRYDEKASFVRAIGDSSSLEYIHCLGCGETETKKLTITYHLLNCCKYCGDSAKWMMNYYDKRFKEFSPNRACKQCSKQFTVSLSGSAKRLCPKCKASNEAKSKRTNRQYRTGAKRSARRDGIRYDPYAIFKRDKWKCKLCGIKVQKRNYLLDDAAEVDHIVPLSMGGRDIPSNVQCTCRKCNNDKGATIAGQVSLFAMTSRAG